MIENVRPVTEDYIDSNSMSETSCVKKGKYLCKKEKHTRGNLLQSGDNLGGDK